VSGTRKLRTGVVGVGYFGRFHALKLARHPRVVLVGISDPDPLRLVDIASECGTQAYTDHRELIGMVDAVSIAAPARLHGVLAREFLAAGIHVLVEKPLAPSYAEAETLVRIARDQDLVLQVGHQERAVLAAAGLFDIHDTPRAIDSVRKGPFTGRGTDVDVILDLMTHDLDMVHALNPSAIAMVKATGGRRRSDHLDEVETTLTLKDGAIVHIVASRVAEARERRMRIDYACGHIAVDFLTRTVENTTPYVLGDLFPAGESQVSVAGDPLGFAIDRFIAAALGEGKPLVSGEEAAFTLMAGELIAKAAAEKAMT